MSCFIVESNQFCFSEGKKNTLVVTPNINMDNLSKYYRNRKPYLNMTPSRNPEKNGVVKGN